MFAWKNTVSLKPQQSLTMNLNKKEFIVNKKNLKTNEKNSIIDSMESQY